MQLENYKNFAEAYSTFNVEPLIEALADDCIFESQIILQPLEGKPDIEENLRHSENLKHTSLVRWRGSVPAQC